MIIVIGPSPCVVVLGEIGIDKLDTVPFCPSVVVFLHCKAGRFFPFRSPARLVLSLGHGIQVNFHVAGRIVVFAADMALFAVVGRFHLIVPPPALPSRTSSSGCQGRVVFSQAKISTLSLDHLPVSASLQLSGERASLSPGKQFHSVSAPAEQRVRGVHPGHIPLRFLT